MNRTPPPPESHLSCDSSQQPSCMHDKLAPHPPPHTYLAIDPPAPCGAGTTSYHWPRAQGSKYENCPELHIIWMCITLCVPYAYRVIRTFLFFALHMTRAVCSAVYLLLGRALTAANTCLASAMIWFLLKRPAWRVALYGHRRLWLLRATVLLLACQTQSTAASLNVSSPPPMNRSRTRHRSRHRPSPSSPWNVAFLHWYIHVFMLGWGYWLPRPGNQTENPPTIQGRMEHSHYNPPQEGSHTSKLLWDISSHLITLSHDVHPNPRWHGTHAILVSHGLDYYASRVIRLGNDVEMNLGPQHAAFLTLNVGGPHLSRARWGKLLQEITASEPMIVCLQEVRFR